MNSTENFRLLAYGKYSNSKIVTFIVSVTSPCSLNRSTTFLWKWQDGGPMEIIYFGDHGPSASPCYAHVGGKCCI